MNVREGLGVGGPKRLPDIDLTRSTVESELVRERDVDVPIRGLGQLGELGSLGVLNRPHLRVEHAAIELDRALGARRVDSTDDLRVLAQVFENPTGVEALWAEGELEPCAGLQSRFFFEDRPEPAPRRADRQG